MAPLAASPDPSTTSPFTDQSRPLPVPSDVPAHPPISSWHPSLRSLSSMRGLFRAETGDAMVELDLYARPGTSGYRVGQRIDPAHLTPGGSNLSASDTLLQISAPPHTSTAELRILLGNAIFRLKRNASVVLPAPLHSAVSNDHTLALEKAKSHARVELDIVLESETCVQGCTLKGHITIHVRRNASKTPVLLSRAKVRVVGYEAIPYGDIRCTFYQCTALLSHVAPAWDSVLAGPPNQDGWAEAKEGIHLLPFSLTLPADDACGTAKGPLDIHSGVALRYFAMASLRLKDPETSAESIAHFYRSCEIWPRLSLANRLSPAPRPLVSEAARTVFMGGSGKVRLTAVMHRLYWVAGQRCVINLRVINDSKKPVKGASITLLRATTVFKPIEGRHGNIDPDPDACQTTTMRKVVAANALVMGQKCTKGHASAKGWWTGVKPGDTAEFVHHIILPPDALSVPRVRLLEVEYTLIVTVTTGGLSSDVQVTLPIRIINFLSIDPPPTPAIAHLHGRLRAKPQLGRSETWYRKSRRNDSAGETVPGMKYSGVDMTVVAQEGGIRSTTSLASLVGDPTRDSSGDSPSIYPSESAGTITQRLNVTASLDDISGVIGSDSRIHNFVTGAGQLTGSGSLGSRRSLRGPRGPRLASLPEAIAPLSPQEESTPQKRLTSNTLQGHAQEGGRANKESVQPFVARQPVMTRAPSMRMARSGADEDP